LNALHDRLQQVLQRTEEISEAATEVELGIAGNTQQQKAG